MPILSNSGESYDGTSCRGNVNLSPVAPAITGMAVTNGVPEMPDVYGNLNNSKFTMSCAIEGQFSVEVQRYDLLGINVLNVDQSVFQMG